MQPYLSFLTGLVIYGSFPEVLGDSRVLFDRLCEVACDHFFEVIELPVLENEAEWDSLHKIVEEARLQVVAAAGPSCILQGWNLSSLDFTDRQRALRGMKKAIEYSYAIGARQLVFVSGRDPDELARPAAKAALRSSLQELAEYASDRASQYTLALSVEAADRTIMHKQLLGPTEEVADFVRQMGIDSTRLNVTLDMSHVPQLGETLERATDNLGPLVGHAHIANALISDPARPEYGDKHPRFGLPGGQFDDPDIARFIQLVTDRCFAGRTFFPYDLPVFSLEVKPTVGLDPHLGLAGIKRLLRQALQALN